MGPCSNLATEGVYSRGQPCTMVMGREVSWEASTGDRKERNEDEMRQNTARTAPTRTHTARSDNAATHPVSPRGARTKHTHALEETEGATQQLRVHSDHRCTAPGDHEHGCEDEAALTFRGSNAQQAAHATRPSQPASQPHTHANTHTHTQETHTGNTNTRNTPC
jgi:hypothetical protein